MAIYPVDKRKITLANLARKGEIIFCIERGKIGTHKHFKCLSLKATTPLRNPRNMEPVKSSLLAALFLNKTLPVLCWCIAG